MVYKEKFQSQFENLGFRIYIWGFRFCSSSYNRFELVLLFKSNWENIIRIKRRNLTKASFTELGLRKKTSSWPCFFGKPFWVFDVPSSSLTNALFCSDSNFLVWLGHAGRLGDMILFQTCVCRCCSYLVPLKFIVFFLLRTHIKISEHLDHSILSWVV